MQRSRVRSALLGLAILLVNALIVVGVVTVSGHRPSDGPEAAPSVTPSGPATPGASGTQAAAAGGAAAGPAAPFDTLATADRRVTIAVLGDGTGDEDGEWVQALARMLGDTRQVSLRALEASDPTRYAKAEKFGSEGPDTTIWNGSRRGTGAGYAARRLTFLVPGKPDLVVLNYGRDDEAGAVAKGLGSTYDALRAAWPTVPVVVTLQPPNRDDEIAPVRESVAQWAEAANVPTIDVAAAFTAVGDPNRFVSVEDPPSVTSKGGRLWARTVLEAIGGDVSPYPDNGSLPQIWDTEAPAAEPTDAPTDSTTDAPAGG